MESYRRLIEYNRGWAAAMTAADPDYFERSARHRPPPFLYIGCADSRVPSGVAAGVEPGELFVHRNVANLVLPSDLNAMSVVQYAVDVLEVEHVIVAGHYDCDGVRAAIDDHSYGLIDHWLGPVRNVARWNRAELDAVSDDRARFDRLVELNVLEQIYHLSEVPCVQQAWARGRGPRLHGVVYDLRTGLLRELASDVDSQAAAEGLAALRLSGVPAGPPAPGARPRAGGPR